MPIMTFESYLNRLAERTYDNTRQLRKQVQQRRNGMEDLYGTFFSANGDATNPATFYVSLSPNYVYLEMFAFKFIIKPFASSVSGVSVSGEGVTIGETELALEGSSSASVISGTSTLGDGGGGLITPNPHTHSVSGGSMSGNLNYGIKQINTSSADWRVVIDGIDITEYLIEQHDGDWITSEGVYPNNRLEDVEDFYDILDVASVMTAEGRTTEREKLLQQRFKKVQIYSDAPFGVDAYLYMKFSHMNR